MPSSISKTITISCIIHSKSFIHMSMNFVRCIKSRQSINPNISSVSWYFLFTSSHVKRIWICLTNMLQTPASGNVSKFTTCWTIHRIKQWSKNKGGGPGKKNRYLEGIILVLTQLYLWENKKYVKRVNLHSTYWCRWAESPGPCRIRWSWTPATGGWRLFRTSPTSSFLVKAPRGRDELSFPS